MLCAAHEYRQAYEQYGHKPHSRQPLRGDLSGEQDAGCGVEPTRDDAPPLEMELFDELAHRYHIHCKSCGGAVTYVRWEAAQKGVATIHYRCRACDAICTRHFTKEQFEAALASAA